MQNIDITLAESLRSAGDYLNQTARFLLENAKKDNRFVGAVAHNFLMMMGYVAGAYYMARAALQATEKSDTDEFYRKKMVSVRFYFSQILPRYLSYMHAVTGGADVGIGLSEDCF